MINSEIFNLIKFIKKKINLIFCTHKCPVCKQKTSCGSGQFIKKNGKIKCIHCDRYLEPVKERFK